MESMTMAASRLRSGGYLRIKLVMEEWGALISPKLMWDDVIKVILGEQKRRRA